MMSSKLHPRGSGLPSAIAIDPLAEEGAVFVRWTALDKAVASASRLRYRDNRNAAVNMRAACFSTNWMTRRHDIISFWRPDHKLAGNQDGV